MAVTNNSGTGEMRFSAQADSVTIPLYVKAWRWVDEAADGVADDTLDLTDPVTTREIVFARAPGTSFTEEVLVEALWRNGVTVTTMDSGVLYLRLK